MKIPFRFCRWSIIFNSPFKYRMCIITFYFSYLSYWKSNIKIKYICSSPETLRTNRKFDVILNMEIIKHVDDIDFFIKKSSQLLKKNGLMFVATLNKTLKSYFFAIIGAEYVLRWLPIGTHDWQKFLKPEEIEKKLIKLNLNKLYLNGLKFNILSNSWSLSSNCSVNYIMVVKKN